MLLKKFISKKILFGIIVLLTSSMLFAAVDANSLSAPETANPLTDVNTIVNKANIVAYYQGDDGKADVKMTITNKQGQQRNREFTILRKDVKNGGDQKYFVYFHRPADVRKMVYMVHKHAELNEDDDRWLYLPALGRFRLSVRGCFRKKSPSRYS
jgi:hypothetical protein